MKCYLQNTKNRIEENNGKINSGCMDDGETGASARMLNIMHVCLLSETF